ncbi:MAG: 3-methyl-2-oxobutanoate hydroxymethyltransferase [Bdellovibrionales bacterium]
MARKTIQEIRNHKGNPSPLVCLTAYTMRVAQLLDPHCDLLLVGDSMGMVLYGMDNTRDVDLDMIIRHGAGVVRGANHACVIVDMPFGTYEDSAEQALANAKRIMDNTGADGVKLEGGEDLAPHVRAIVDADIPVIGHIGLLPQTAQDKGGFKVQGRTDDGRAQLIKDGKAIEKAGAAAVVIEAVIEDVAQDITQAIPIPTIGIGASRACDGQILVTEDMVGITGDHVPKFVKQYAQVSADIAKAAEDYAADVRSRRFPFDENVYKPKKG